MPTIGELINNIAQKAGIAADDPKLKSLLASPELASVQVDAELATAVDSALISVEAAKNNHPDIRNKYTSEVYDSMDKNLYKIMDEGDFTDEDKAEIKAVPKTRERYALAIEKLKAQKLTAKGADKDAINKQLEQAHEAARLAKEEKVNVVKEYEGKIKNIHRDMALNLALSNYKTIYDDLPGKAKVTAMKAVIDEALQDKNAQLVADENGNLTLVSKDGSSNVFDSAHRQLTPTSFLDQAFASILKVSGPPKPAAQPPRPQPVTGQQPDDKTEVIVSQLKSHADTVIANMAAQPASMI